jgi:hypothetical protein
MKIAIAIEETPCLDSFVPPKIAMAIKCFL